MESPPWVRNGVDRDMEEGWADPVTKDSAFDRSGTFNRSRANICAVRFVMSEEAKKSEGARKSEKEQQEALKKIYAFAMQEIKAGADKIMLTEKLVEMGVDKAAAEEIYDQFMRHAEKEKYSRSSIIRGLIGGIIAAVIGGVIWGYLVIATKYEIGFVAWGVGGLAGYAVVLAAKGKKESRFKSSRFSAAS